MRVDDGRQLLKKLWPWIQLSLWITSSFSFPQAFIHYQQSGIVDEPFPLILPSKKQYIIYHSPPFSFPHHLLKKKRKRKNPGITQHIPVYILSRQPGFERGAEDTLLPFFNFFFNFKFKTINDGSLINPISLTFHLTKSLCNILFHYHGGILEGIGYINKFYGINGYSNQDGCTLS